MTNYKFIDPIRVFKENDPYIYEVDNIPLDQLQNNCRYLKEKVESLTDSGLIDRSGFSELKPYVNGSDNVIRVLPGRYNARINDAYNKTPLQRLVLINAYIAGDNRYYRSDLSLTQYDEIINRVWSESTSLGLNGLIERIFSWRISNPDLSLSTVTAPFGGLPSTGANTDTDKPPLVFHSPFTAGFYQTQIPFIDLNKLSAEFCKMWRGVARTAIVDVSEELSVSIPAFNADDFKVSGNTATTPITRIDLVFVYSHPVDTSSTTIIQYTNSTPRTINSPVLGVLKGAGAVLAVSNNPAFPNNVNKALDSNNNSQMLASVADQFDSNLGFKELGVMGSFPAPDDLMNIAPNLIETLEANNPQLIGQSVLPICYVVVRKNSSVNSAGEQVITTTDIIDIRPFFRTTELTYNERAGIVAASPPLSFANPAVGQAQLDYQLNAVKSQLVQVVTQSQQSLPRVVAGGTIWGGTKFGPEGAIRLAAKLLAGVADSNLPFSDAPTFPDWDIADWWAMYNGTGGGDSSNIGSRRNDRINLYRTNKDVQFDSGTDPTNSLDITTATRWIGTQNFLNRGGNPFCFYWAKKEVLIDRSLVPWMQDYTVECAFQNCLPQTHKASRSGDKYHDDESGSSGIWVERKFDRFIIYIGWLATSPARYNQDGINPPNKEPRQDRDSFKFSGFITRHSDMGLPVSNNGTYLYETQSLDTKVPRVGACTYPTITFKVTGYPSEYYYKSLTQYPQLSLIQLK